MPDIITEGGCACGTVGRLVASVLFGLAEIEQEYRRERQAAGIAVAKRRGVYRGRAKGTTKAKPARARDACRKVFAWSRKAKGGGGEGERLLPYMVELAGEDKLLIGSDFSPRQALLTRSSTPRDAGTTSITVRE